jgi:ketosteroid isomerase-like protein
MNEELVARFFAAVESGDIGTLREIYAPDAVIWHNDDLIEQPVEENLKVQMYLRMRGGRITRIEEYLDSGRRAAIKAAREALPN